MIIIALLIIANFKFRQKVPFIDCQSNWTQTHAGDQKTFADKLAEIKWLIWGKMRTHFNLSKPVLSGWSLMTHWVHIIQSLRKESDDTRLFTKGGVSALSTFYVLFTVHRFNQYGFNDPCSCTVSWLDLNVKFHYKYLSFYSILLKPSWDQI